MRFRTLSTFIIIGSSVGLLAGCGGGGGGGSSRGSASTTAATTSATPSPLGSGSTAGAGSSATSGLSSSSAAATPAAAVTTPSGPDRSPPVITLVSPTRGLHTTLQVARVEGTAVDQTGVAYLVINGAAVQVGAGGQFVHAVPLTSGLNIIELEAGDPLGQRTRTVLPVVSGQFLPEASNVGDALAVRLNRPAFDAIERLAAQQLAGQNLAAMIMAQNPLFTQSAGIADVTVTATSATFGAPTLDLNPQAGGLRVRVEIPNVDVRVRAAGRVLGIPYGVNVSVTSTLAVVEATAVVAVSNGTVTTTLQNVVVSLQNFRFDIGGIPTFLENLARDAVRRLLESQIKRQVEQVVPQEVNRAIAGATGPIVQTVLGRQVSLHLIPKAVTFDVNGASILTDGDLRLPPPPAPLGLPTTPGSLTTAGAAPTHATAPAFHLSLNDDLLNRMGHAAWRGGLMSMKIDQAAAAQLGLPAWVQLDAFLLTIFFPQLNGRVNPADPLEIELSTGTPALFQTAAPPGLLDCGIGDVTVSFFVAPAGRPRQLVLRVGAQARVTVQPSLGPNNVLKLDVVGRPTIKTDVFETPVAALDELAVESFVDFLLPPVLQLLPRAWSGFPLPVYPGLAPRGVLFERSGPSNDFVTIKGDL